LDLFSGIGGFSLGLERAGMTTVAFCEIEKYQRQVIRKHWPDIPIYNDIRTLRGADVGPIDIICGGYPCQPFSVAGERGGADDDRYLWPEYLRLIRELRPRWIIGENVTGHINLGFDGGLSDLEGENYRWESFIIPACAVDAKHRRDRVWFVAYAGGERLQVPEQNNLFRARGWDQGRAITECSGWPVEPAVGRVAYGIPRRVDRLKGLGNAVVPQIPEILGRAIIATEGG